MDWASELSSPLGIERLSTILEQRMAEAVNAAERRAEVVRDGIGNGFELFVGSFQLEGAFVDAAVEVVVRFYQIGMAELDLAQHFIEGLDENADFVVVFRGRGAQVIVLVAGDNLGDLGEVDDGFGNGAPQEGGKQECRA